MLTQPNLPQPTHSPLLPTKSKCLQLFATLEHHSNSYMARVWTRVQAGELRGMWWGIDRCMDNDKDKIQTGVWQ